MKTAQKNFTALTQAFITIRKLDIVARQQFSCCQGCGCAELADRAANGEYEGKRGYLFYHKQDFERLLESGSCHISFGTFGEGDDDDAALRIAADAVMAFQAKGIGVEWNGSTDQRIQVNLHG